MKSIALLSARVGEIISFFFSISNTFLALSIVNITFLDIFKVEAASARGKISLPLHYHSAAKNSHG